MHPRSGGKAIFFHNTLAETMFRHLSFFSVTDYQCDCIPYEVVVETFISTSLSFETITLIKDKTRLIIFEFYMESLCWNKSY